MLMESDLIHLRYIRIMFQDEVQGARLLVKQNLPVHRYKGGVYYICPRQRRMLERKQVAFFKT